MLEKENGAEDHARQESSGPEGYRKQHGTKYDRELQI